MFSAGWNDPPVLGLPENNTSASRRRARVYHSVDGVGAAGVNPHQKPTGMYPSAPTIAAGPVPPVLPFGGGGMMPCQPQNQYPMATQPAMNAGIGYPPNPVPQTSLPMMQSLPSAAPQGPTANPPLTYDAPSTISRLAAQVNKVLGDTSLEVSFCWPKNSCMKN